METKHEHWKKEQPIICANIPHSLLFSMIEYKAAQYGIKVMITEESYTSKASFLDDDDIPTYGERDGEKNFQEDGSNVVCIVLVVKWLVNADINGAANIL